MPCTIRTIGVIGRKIVLVPLVQHAKFAIRRTDADQHPMRSREGGENGAIAFNVRQGAGFVSPKRRDLSRPAATANSPLPLTMHSPSTPRPASPAPLVASKDIVQNNISPLAGSKPSSANTGDLAKSDRDDFLTITGRLKELIIRGGQNIAPAEIEEVVNTFESVVDCAVVGIPHTHLGEVPALFVVPRTGGAQIESETILEHCRTHLSSYKVPSSVHFISEIPRTQDSGSRRASHRGKLSAARVRPAGRPGDRHSSCPGRSWRSRNRANSSPAPG